MKIRFNDYECNLVFLQYDNGRPAILLVDAFDGETITTATVNLPYENLDDNEVAIKNYSENEGLDSVLIDAGVISAPIKYIKTGFVDIPICNLLINE